MSGLFGDIAVSHQKRLEILQADRDSKRAVAVEACEQLADSLIANANRGAEQVYSRQWEIETQTRALHKETQRMVKNGEAWIQLYKKFNESLKEVGEVGDWAKAIEKDMKQIVTALEQLADEKEANQLKLRASQQ
eukprot:TRINITY_DN54340_c0_g1_i1.p1 TRINITY_DN54340_c0_g1~~TRINITY_DN54340_c0_g1_i1.p1  ORF type:complete len:145 (-),score=41.24 TRINITY_DN54340_c0_g1_i1:12-416(-)